MQLNCALKHDAISCVRCISDPHSEEEKKKKYSDTQEIIMRFLRYAAFLILRNQSVVKNERNSLELDTGDQDVLEQEEHIKYSSDASC